MGGDHSLARGLLLLDLVGTIGATTFPRWARTSVFAAKRSMGIPIDDGCLGVW